MIADARAARLLLHSRSVQAVSSLGGQAQRSWQLKQNEWLPRNREAPFSDAEFSQLHRDFSPFGPQVADAALANHALAASNLGHLEIAVRAAESLSSDDIAKSAIGRVLTEGAYRVAAHMGHWEGRRYVEPLKAYGIEPLRFVSEIEALSAADVLTGKPDTDHYYLVLDRRGRKARAELMSVGRGDHFMQWGPEFARVESIQRSLSRGDYTKALSMVNPPDFGSPTSISTPTRIECQPFRDKCLALIDQMEFAEAKECLLFSPCDPGQRSLVQQVLDLALVDSYRVNPTAERMNKVVQFATADVVKHFRRLNIVELKEDEVKIPDDATELDPEQWKTMSSEALHENLLCGIKLKGLTSPKHFEALEGAIKLGRGIPAQRSYFRIPLYESLRPKAKKGRQFVGRMSVDVQLSTEAAQTTELALDLEVSLFTSGRSRPLSTGTFTVRYRHDTGRPHTRVVEENDKGITQHAADREMRGASRSALAIERVNLGTMTSSGSGSLGH